MTTMNFGSRCGDRAGNDIQNETILALYETDRCFFVVS
jgi:hypothetical protein